MSKDCMLDIETLSTSTNAIVLTIGALKFQRSENKTRLLKDMDSFYERVCIDSCTKIGLQRDEDTEKWWKTQNKEIYYEAIENKDRIPIQDVLRKLSVFVRDCKYIWCQGINFDPVILENAFRKCKIPIPWKYYNLRDTRTVFDICKIDLKTFTKPDVHHNALQDCYTQYLALKQALK
jgi:hypothetical protein